MLIYETFSDFFSWVCSMPDKRLIEELHYLESLIDDSVICESILADIVIRNSVEDTRQYASRNCIDNFQFMVN